MRRILIITGIVLAAIVVVIAALPLVVPVSAYRERIEQIATDATGHQLSIRGKLRLTVFPELGIRADDVTLANAPGGKAPYLATMQSLRVGVRLMALLHGNLQVSEVVLNKPVIHLEMLADGTRNWVVPKSAKTAASENENEEEPVNAQTARFNGVTISGGTLTYEDLGTGKSQTISDIDINFAITRLDHPVTMDGQMTIDKERFSVAAKITAPDAFMKSEPTPVDLSLTSDLVQASFKGNAEGHGKAQGTLKLDTQSLRKFAAWAGHPISTTGGLGQLSLEGKLSVSQHLYALSKVKLVLDGMNITGDLSADTTHDVPFLKGALAVDHVNLNRYIATGGSGGSGSASSSSGGGAKDQGWSKTPIDLSVLKLVNADMRVSVQSLQVQSLKIGRAVIAATLNGGKLDAKLSPITLYGGLGTAHLIADASGGTPAFQNDLQFNDLDIKPFLTDTIGVDRIEGKGNVVLNVTARGNSAYTVMHAIDGKGSIAFKNGKVRGVDLGAVARTIQTAMSGNATGDNAATDFTEMGGTFTIANGVMTNKDFHLLNPFLRISGAGTVDLGERTVDFVVSPKLVSSGKGQGGKMNVAGVGVPFHITGSWSHLRYSPDLSGVTKSILDSVAKGEGVSTKKLLNGLLGISATDKTKKPDADKKKKKKSKSPTDLINNLLGGH